MIEDMSFDPTVFGPDGKLARFCKGGGQMQAPPPPAPPATERAREVTQAKRQTRINEARKIGQAATLLAGETGGAQTERKTLLGM